MALTILLCLNPEISIFEEALFGNTPVYISTLAHGAALGLQATCFGILVYVCATYCQNKPCFGRLKTFFPCLKQSGFGRRQEPNLLIVIQICSVLPAPSTIDHPSPLLVRNMTLWNSLLGKSGYPDAINILDIALRPTTS